MTKHFKTTLRLLMGLGKESEYEFTPNEMLLFGLLLGTSFMIIIVCLILIANYLFI